MRRVVFVALVAFALVAAATASAGVVSTQTISPNPSPFVDCSNQGFAGNYPNAEVEPWVSVDPLDSATAAAWQQDRWGDPSEGGAHGIAAWSSTSGNSWAPFTTCSGGTAANNGNFDRASDVWLSYGPDGRLYQVALVFDEATESQGITVSTSTNDGATWSNPTFVDQLHQKSFTHGDDKESITADPFHPGYAYVVWDRYSNQKPLYTDGHGQNANKGPAFFSRTTDGGKTWSAPQAIFARDNGTIGNQIVVLPNGTLVDFFTNFIAHNVKGGVAFTAELDSVRSNSQGQTWSTPIVVSPMTPNGTYDPTNGQYVRAGDSLFDVAAAPNGTLYAVWQDSLFSGVDQVAFTKSTDGGLTWSMPRQISEAPPSFNDPAGQAFTPSVDVSANGTVAVTYYTFQNTTSAAFLATDYWAITSANAGTSWSPQLRLTPSSFNGELAPIAGGLMIGDYEGLAHRGNTFTAAYEVGNTQADPTDIQLTTFTP
ncbi:MAG TPA: sialidase family protein [Gaiellaceae bacterium]|nr:sialidase family protein [Gaiellaceae bacterium]